MPQTALACLSTLFTGPGVQSSATVQFGVYKWDTLPEWEGKRPNSKQVQSQDGGLKGCTHDLLKNATKVTEGDKLPEPP